MNIEQKAVHDLLEAAAKLVTDYYTEFRTTRYITDEENVERLLSAMKPFERAVPVELKVRP